MNQKKLSTYFCPYLLRMLIGVKNFTEIRKLAVKQSLNIPLHLKRLVKYKYSKFATTEVAATADHVEPRENNMAVVNELVWSQEDQLQIYHPTCQIRPAVGL